MRSKKFLKRSFALCLATALTVTSVFVSDVSADAASSKKVKSITLKIGKKKVTKKVYTLAKTKKATIKVTVSPKKAKKSVSFSSNKKKVATVSKKGVVTAKAAGTAKITVTVKGKDNKKKKTWVKIKVTNAGSTGNTGTTSDTQTTKPGDGVTATTTPTVTPTPTPGGTETPTATATPTPGPTATPEPTAIPTPEPPLPSIGPTQEPEFNYSIGGNPIGTTDENGDPLYGGDPSILVDGDTVYLYVGHDVSTTEDYSIPEYCCYSSTNLKDWSYHGVVLNMKDVSWGDKNAAWAGQVMKYRNQYYLYFCSWDKTSSGKQSIGVAVADNPTGPFTDIGQPLVKGTVTTGQTSDWNDIDPTAWIETDENGQEHRYLCWGNGKVFVCELNADMVSVKDINNDGKITFGTQASKKTSKDVDIIEKNVSSLTYTEAPWLYRRQDADGKYYGDYYLFYAYDFREEMAYATISASDGLMDGAVKFGKVVMPPTATSDTNHMAVFDFKGKTYFVYHNGSLPAGSGHRRTPCIVEINFNEDGSIDSIPESAAGIFGETTKIYTSGQDAITHENFRNSSADAPYPYTGVAVGALKSDDEADSEWVMTDSFYSVKDEDYVSIQSENKPGLYLTANENNSVLLSQNANKDTIDQVAKQQTFKIVPGLNDTEGVSFESVAKPGYYITTVEKKLYLTKGTGPHKAASTFYLNTPPAEKKTDADLDSENSLTKITVGEEYSVTEGEDNTYTISVPYTVKTLPVTFTTNKETGFLMVNGGLFDSSTVNLPVTASALEVSVCAEDFHITESYTIQFERDYSDFIFGTAPVKVFNFEDKTDGAVAVTKAFPPAAVANPTYSYVDGVNDGNALSLTGTYGMELCDTESLGKTYSISFWMKPTTLGGAVDPIFAAGTFDPQYWINITAAERGIWSSNGGYVNLENLPTKKYTTGEWQLVTVTVTSTGKASTGKLYLNGELIASGSVADGVMTRENAKAYFGVNAWDAYFNGAVDEIMLFDRELSVDEIDALYEKVVKASDFTTEE